MFRTYHVTDALSGVSVPTMVVAADRDETCKPEATRGIRVEVPHGDLVPP